MSELEPEIREYYERGGEIGRLAGDFPSGPLELARTQELILRHLPDRELYIIDIGGGPGSRPAGRPSLMPLGSSKLRQQ